MVFKADGLNFMLKSHSLAILIHYQNPVTPPALSETDRLWIQELLK